DRKASALDRDLRRTELAHPKVAHNLVGASDGFMGQGYVEERLVGSVAGHRPSTRDPEIISACDRRGRCAGRLQSIGNGRWGRGGARHAGSWLQAKGSGPSLGGGIVRRFENAEQCQPGSGGRHQEKKPPSVHPPPTTGRKRRL